MSPRSADRAFAIGGATAASLVLAVLVAVAMAVFDLALPSMRAFGAGFVGANAWDPNHQTFGALPFVFGTAVTSFVALVIAVPLGLGVAMFLTDLGPRSLRRPVRLLIDLLAAIPSVVFGLWGVVVLAPHLVVGPTSYGLGLMCGSLVLSIMILPTIAAVAREVLSAVPAELREGALALGATRWDVVRGIVLPHARSGLFGAVLLGLGRALGETMAMAAVIGSRPQIPSSIFGPGYTMASVIANEFPTAASTLHVAALAEIGLALFVVTLVFNVAARMLVGRVRGLAFAMGAR